MTQTARYHEPAPEHLDAEAFRQVVISRRSVRRFTDEAIPQAVLDDCLDMALLAPNSSNLQPWEFYVVRTPKIRTALIQHCMAQNAASTAAELIVVVARTDSWREHARMNIDHFPVKPVPKVIRQYYGLLVPFVYNQGPLDSLGLLRRRLAGISSRIRAVPKGPCSTEEMRLWATKSTALAAENLMLALRAHGYDSCPMEGFDERRVARLLKLNTHGIPIMVIGAGKRADDGVYYPRIRFARERFVHTV